MKIEVANIIHSSYAAYHQEGLDVFALVEKAISKRESVELSFKGVEVCSTMFLNACVGKLYVSYPVDVIDGLLSYSNTDQLISLRSKLNDVKANALRHELHDAEAEESYHK